MPLPLPHPHISHAISHTSSHIDTTSFRPCRHLHRRKLPVHRWKLHGFFNMDSQLDPQLDIHPAYTNDKLPPPAGWSVYFVQPGETLASIATRYGISSAKLQTANCLLTTELIPGAVIYVLLCHHTPLPCGAPHSWIVYIVRPGDTLYRLSIAYGITVADLQRANCLGSSTFCIPGNHYMCLLGCRTQPGLPLRSYTSQSTRRTVFQRIPSFQPPLIHLQKHPRQQRFRLLHELKP